MIVQAPDNKTIDFGDLPPDQVQAAMQKLYPPQNQPSMLDQATKQLGLTARYATNFATGLPGMVGDAANMAINGVTSGINLAAGTKIPQLQMPSQLVDQGLTKLGLPQPHGSLENVVGDMSKAVATTGGSVALGGMAPELSPLAQNPMMQGRAALGASGASGITRELGGGPVAQTLAGLGGGYLATRTPFASEPQLTANDIYKKASQSYQYANENGGLATPQYTNKFLDQVENTVPPQTLAGKMTSGSNELTDLLNRWKILRDKPLTLNAIDEMDKGLNDLVNTKGIEDGQITPIGRKLLQIKDLLRQTALNPEAGDLVGGTDGFEAWKQGIDQWSQASKLSDLEYIINRAKMMPQPTTALQTGFRNLSLQLQDNPRGYTPEEVDAITNAAKVGLGTQFFKVFGSRLVPLMATGLGGTIGTALDGPLGGLAGSTVGGLAGYGGSELSGSLATKMQMNRANQATQMIANRFTPPPQSMILPKTLGTIYGINQ